MSREPNGSAPHGKVARLLAAHELDDFGDYLVDRWTADDADERLSLRALARVFNRRLLEAHLLAANVDPMERTVESYYEALSDDDVSSGVRTRVRRTLEREGVDVDALTDEFVSRQAIHTYLTKTRGVSKPDASTTLTPSSVRETIDRLRERTRQVAASKLERLREVGAVDIGAFQVVVDVQVYCADCGTQTDLQELLVEGSCDCS